ncbi:pentatricopeptide repeat-containing protein At5g15280, mitochondrial [Aristolochia californica]|uniref:pentatricopeptide repeat-containing protein At5g15280, mitochondrial n=1 Tax=Aristolochia californica TaxID=171875 RepID=UPI0035E35044
MRRAQNSCSCKLFSVSYLRLLRPVNNLQSILGFQVRSCASATFNSSGKASFFSVKSHSQSITRIGPLSKSPFFLGTELFSSCSVSQFSFEQSKPTLSPGEETERKLVGYDSIRHCGIGQSVISKCSYIWEEKIDSFGDSSLQDLLLASHSLPAVTRRFWRVSALRPEDVLAICLAFEYRSTKLDVEAKDVEFLWKLFSWAANQGGDFCHLPQSNEIMVSLLVRAGMIRKAWALLQKREICRITFGRVEVFDKIIEEYVKARELETSITLYDQARTRGIVLSNSCYNRLLDFLVESNEAQLTQKVLMNMIDNRLFIDVENHFEYVVGALCKERKIQEARILLKKVAGLGIHPGRAVLNEIADGYCKKKDFVDLLNFLNEQKHVPDSHICNRIISSQCKHFGTEKGWTFLLQLEALGFQSDEITFAILINWSCKEGKLKDGFIYLSELISRNLKPNVRAYDALIAGVFVAGIGTYAKDIFCDMIEKEVVPNEFTFRVLLAGYCRNREFEEVKMIAKEMVKLGLLYLSSSEYFLSKIFVFMGLDRLNVRVKRDNDPVLPKAEFFDGLGNGMYLDTDTEEYNKTLTGILRSAIVPDLDFFLKRECVKDNIKGALGVKSEISHWGQPLSSSAYSVLLQSLCRTKFHSDSAAALLDEMVEMRGQLDTETLNLLIQTTSYRKMMYKSRLTLDWMLKRELPADNETFSAVIIGLGKEGNRVLLQKCLEVARDHNWLPAPKDWKALVHYLCKLGMLKEALQLLKDLLEKNLHVDVDICNVFLKELSVRGFTSAGYELVKEVLGRGLELNAEAFNHLIRGLCKDKYFYQAFEVLDIMLQKNIVPCIDVCRMLIPLLCWSNQLEKAIALKELFSEQAEVSVSVKNALINGFCRIRKVNDAVFLLQEMIENRERPDDETFNVLLQEFCRGDNLIHTLELQGFIFRRSVSFSISTYRFLVHLMCKHRRFLDVLSLKNFMLRESGFPHIVLYNILIFYLFQTSKSSLVTELLDEMDEKCLSLDQNTYNFLIYGYYKVNLASKSIEALHSMMIKNLKPSNRSLRLAISYFSHHGRLEKVLELSRTMEIRGWPHSSVVQNTLVEALVSYGKVQEAEQFLGQIQEKGLIPKNVDYDILIRRFSQLGRLKKAVELLNVMLGKGGTPSDISYNSIICGLCTHGALDEALDFHEEMLCRNMIPSIKSCEMLVHSLCAYRKASEAEIFMVGMLKSGLTPTSGMYQLVIDQYCSDNNLPKASRLLHEMHRIGYEANFKTQWSIITGLSKGDDKNTKKKKGFLSQLLSQCSSPTLKQA